MKKPADILHQVIISRGKFHIVFAMLGGIAFAGLLLTGIVVSLMLDHALTLPSPFSLSLKIILGAPSLIIGGPIYLWCVIKFFKEKGSPVPVMPPTILITEGFYAYSRNPMITGMFAVIFGVGVLLNSFSIVFLFLPVAFGVMFIFIAFVEEPELGKRFGQEYRNYKKTVPRFFPDPTVLKKALGRK